jgi:uncharacterized protein YkwD
MRFTALLSAFVVALGVDAIAIPEPDGTLSARQSQTSTDPLWTDHVKFRDALLKRHNDFRGAHAVGKLTWNTTLSGFAGKYLQKRGTGKNTCPNFEHSGGPYGENLAIGYGTPTQAVSAWGDERAEYNFNKPGFSSATGHFTQMVWKDTRQVGCARKYCTSSNVYRGWYLACEYWPRGNVIGQFDKQVLKGRYKQKRDGEDLSPRDDVLEDEEDFLEDFDGEAYNGEPLVFFDN